MTNKGKRLVLESVKYWVGITNKGKRLVLESIIHWERMREWVKKQPPDSVVDENDMRKAINEWWKERDCPLCQEYFSCINCLLNLKGDCCNDPNSSWKKVNNAKTWGEWLEASEGMIESLKEIEVEEV